MKTVYATPSRPGQSMPPTSPQTRHTPDASPAKEGRKTTAFRDQKDRVDANLPPNLLPGRLTDALLASCRRWPGAIEEIRLRAGRYATLTVDGRNVPTRVLLSTADLTALLTHMCGGSLYAYSQTINQGYIALPGGIRVGVAGRAICEEGRVIGVCEISGLCIRLPHRHEAMGGEVCRLLRRMAAEGGSPRGVLIYAPPGVGKTTLLRAVAASMAGGHDPWRTVVIDTRGELGFDTDSADLCLDILGGYPRARGVEIATRTLSAQLILCDEIGDVEEAMALISAHHGGVPLVASAHAGTVDELLRRTGIRLLHEARLFGAYVGIRRADTNGDGLPGRHADFIYHITPWEEAERAVGGGV